MRIEDRPTRRDSQKGIVIVLAFTVILICLYVLLITLATPIEDLPYGMHPEPIQTIYEEDVEVITEEVSLEQDAPLVSEDDLMARVIQAEAGREPFVGKVAVATVILNRADYFDMTIYEVLTKPNQFAIPSLKATEDCYKAVEFARENRDLFPSNMIYFRNQYYHPKLGEPYVQIGGHYFSVEKGDE